MPRASTRPSARCVARRPPPPPARAPAHTRARRPQGICQNADDSESWSTTYLNANHGSLPQTYSTTGSATWYDSGATMPSAFCHCQSVANCYAVCAAIPDCAYFAVSVTLSCYACFVSKTCAMRTTHDYAS